MYGVVNTYLSLEEYWQFLQINECAGYGIRNFPTSGVIGMGCGDYWQQSSRYYLAAAIAKSESRLETDRWLGFPVRRKYEKPRQMEWQWPVYLGKYVRGVGVQAETAVETVNLTLSADGSPIDPVTFTVNVDFTDEDELIIRYPTAYYLRNCDSYTIRPSCVTIADGVATVEIPRCRLLRPEYFKDYKNDNERPNYVNDNYFLDTVEVQRNYLNETTGANLVWRRHRGQLYCSQGVITCNPSGPCADVKQLACAYVRTQRDGMVQLEPASYSDGWTKSDWAVKRNPDQVEINYMRGYYDRYEEIDPALTRAIVALAHNNLPRKYCHCDQQTLYYEEDTRAVEPAVRLKGGRSTWGVYEAEQIVREFDARFESHHGGML